MLRYSAKPILSVGGGPPCQGFSTANRQRIIDDPRNNLYKAYLQFLSVIRPKFFVMENVRGMANKIEEIKQNFREFLGDEYQFEAAVLQAQDFGIPQNRKRLIMIGNRMTSTESRQTSTSRYGTEAQLPSSANLSMPGQR